MIRAENIKKSFGNLLVLKGIDFEAKAAEVVSIVGASGAGKSSLLQILGTLSYPDTVQLAPNTWYPILSGYGKGLHRRG